MSKTHVPLDQIRDNPHQPRLDVGDVEGLAETILEHGLRQLPEGRLLRDSHVVTGSLTTHTRREEEGWFLEDGPEGTEVSVQLAAGHRRVEAVRLLNDDDTVTDADLRAAGLVPGYVPVDLQRLTDDDMLDLLTIENAHREELSAIEQARLIGELAEAGRSGEEVAERFGKSASWVSNRKRLLELPEYVQTKVHEGDITVRQAGPLVKAQRLEDEHPDVVQGVSFDLKPGTLVKDAERGVSSSDLREKAQALKGYIEVVLNSKDELEEDAEADERIAPLPAAWHWSDGDPEAAGFEDVGHRVFREWGTSNGTTVRSRISAGTKQRAIERAHSHEKSLKWASLKSRLSGIGKPSLPDGWIWEITKIEDGHAQIGAFRYEGEPTCPAGWSASADGEDIYEQAKDAIRIEKEIELTDQSHDPDRDRKEAQAGDGEADAGARPQEDLRGDDGGGSEQTSSEDQAPGPSVDAAKRDASAGAADREVNGDQAPAEHVPVTDTGGAPRHLSEVIAQVEADGHEWQIKTVGPRGYEALIRTSGAPEIAEGDTPADALQSAHLSVQGADVGQVIPAQVDELLSGDGVDMWNEDAAARATIASLLVAHRVAGARQEAWRTREIADVVQERVGSVTEDDVADEVLADVEAEVKARLEPETV